MRTRMLVGHVVAAALLGASAAATGMQATGPTALEPLAFLLGTWEAIGSGKPGEATGRATFAPSLQDRIMIRTSYAETPGTPTAPASRHDDLLVIHAAEGGLRADYYDNEGHVIRYAVGVPAPGAATFVSDIVSGSPRYRLAYQLGSDGILRGTFAVAPPGKPEAFAQYLSWESRKTETGGKKAS
jgi:hypothetical protein